MNTEIKNMYTTMLFYYNVYTWKNILNPVQIPQKWTTSSRVKNPQINGSKGCD